MTINQNTTDKEIIALIKKDPGISKNEIARRLKGISSRPTTLERITKLIEEKEIIPVKTFKEIKLFPQNAELIAKAKTEFGEKFYSKLLAPMNELQMKKTGKPAFTKEEIKKASEEDYKKYLRETKKQLRKK